MCSTMVLATQNILVKIHKIAFFAVDMLQCLHGGFAVLTEEAELLSFCEPHGSVSDDIPVNIYAAGAQVLLVLYWYPDYSNISVVVTAELTTCNQIMFDPCAFRVHCPIGKQNYLAKNCAKYVSEHSTTGMSLAHYNINSGTLIEDQIAYMLKANSCNVIQIKAINGSNDGECSAHFVIDTVFLHGYLIHNITVRSRYSAFSSPAFGVEAQGEQINVWGGRQNIKVTMRSKYFTEIKTKWQFHTESKNQVGVQSSGISVKSFPGFVQRAMVKIKFEGTQDNSQRAEIKTFFRKANSTECHSGDKVSPINLNCLTQNEKVVHPVNLVSMAQDEVILFKHSNIKNTFDQVIKIQTWSEYTGIHSSHWKRNLGWMVHKFSKSLEEGYEVALPGLALRMTWSFNCSGSPPDTYLIHGRYKTFQHVWYTIPEKCAACSHFETPCQCYSSLKHCKGPMIFITSVRELNSFEASGLCTQIEGALPVFLTEDELEEFLALVKTREPRYVEGIFLGLNKTKTSQVRIWTIHRKIQFCLCSAELRESCIWLSVTR